MKLLNIKTPVTRNFIPQMLLNVQDFYFHKVGSTQVMTKASSDLRQSISTALPLYMRQQLAGTILRYNYRQKQQIV
jgi:hypothetical protein